MGIRSSPFGVLGFVSLAIELFATPAQFEGGSFVQISPGHALSVLDSLALLLLFNGIAWLNGGLWQRREQLSAVIRQAPGASSTAVIIGGFGLGLLIASAFSTFFRWWDVGAALFGAMILAALAAVTRNRNNSQASTK